MNNSIVGAIALVALSISNTLPISAHEVETSENVGATLHIEPNDNPKAGQPSQAWFALTREGGDPIPLDKCDCKLSISSEPKLSQPILQPTLKPLSTEGYKNIPSAEVTFPKVGIYNLEITGKPIGGEDFKPFKLNFKVTVASSVAQIPIAPPEVNLTKPQTIPKTSGSTSESPNQFLIPISGFLGVVGILGAFLYFKTANKSA